VISFQELTNELKTRNIRLSHQRLKVLEFLTNHKIHPTADQIYTALHQDVPTLSKTTVYSTLNALADAGMVRVLTIEDNEVRYDITVEDHGHIKCESCGRIYDFEADMSVFHSDKLKDFKITEKNVYFKGVCPQCRKNKS
jgi:Fe2+/Zn2+ uptake regulation proteins